MIAVSNTTPLRYLIAIGQDDLLGRLFEKVFVRTGVHEELTDPGRRRPCAATSCRDQPGLRFVPCEKLTQRSFQSRCTVASGAFFRSSVASCVMDRIIP